MTISLIVLTSIHYTCDGNIKKGKVIVVETRKILSLGGQFGICENIANVWHLRCVGVPVLPTSLLVGSRWILPLSLFGTSFGSLKQKSLVCGANFSIVEYQFMY